jgi:release factor glutamine methyltransferase
VTAIDVSPEALALAHENVARTGIEIELLEHDLREGLPAGPWDLVVSNPPYVEQDELSTLMPDVRDFEPHLALIGRGATEAVARGAATVLAPGAWLVLEVGDGQAAETAALLDRLGYLEISTAPDLTGRARVVEGRRDGG